jgi:hypothetical protein
LLYFLGNRNTGVGPITFSFGKLPERQSDLLELSQGKLIDFLKTIAVLFPNGFCV